MASGRWPGRGSSRSDVGLVDAEEHDHEQEQDDDGAGVDDDLHGGEQVGLLGHEEHGHAEQGPHQRQGVVDRVAEGDDAHGAGEHDGRADDEDDRFHQARVLGRPARPSLRRRAHAVAELAGPGHDALVLGVAGRRGGPHPGRAEQVLALPPVLPGQLLGLALVVHQQLVAGVDGVLAVGEGELEELGLGDGLGGAGLDAEVAVDAAQVVDLVDEAPALAGADRVVGRVVGAPHVDAAGRTDPGAQLAADALLHAVLVPVEDVTAVEADAAWGPSPRDRAR